MKKAKKKLAEDFTALLSQTHQEIQKAIGQNETALAMDLLSQCQEGAVNLGNMIESEEGEDAPTIPLLEDYCELIYQIYEKLRTDQPQEAAQGYMDLCSSLTHIQKSVREDITVCREAVFLPYKASMWDSLESVWKAADEDPQWDAYVIPIPYYDKNPDGSFREMHDERDQYPAYVPITSYETFDFSAHKPDMIFIHNPYDEYNYVTSVHPFFYTKNLKKFTEKLIYIPYFVLDEPDPESETDMENIKHFCTVPGVYNADQVIVQSENMQKLYVNILAKETGEDTRPYWEEKILGLGSPKFDKVADTAEEDLMIPESWKHFLYRPDGARKKVILYNTSVGALLDKGEEMLKKMQDVFQIFKDRQEDTALLWRPHPLIKATISSMRPQLWQEYEKLVDQYKMEGWGIYDDSADLDRAITLCDAYYGDGSSLVQLCQKAGKPVMIQNTEILEHI